MTPAAIRLLRSRLGMTREQFAFALHVSPMTVWRWEMGQHVPRGTAAIHLRALARRDVGTRIIRRRGRALTVAP